MFSCCWWAFCTRQFKIQKRPVISNEKELPKTYGIYRMNFRIVLRQKVSLKGDEYIIYNFEKYSSIKSVCFR